jgi:peptidoglycan/LPS O-acetylase OafA/YrhL
MSSSFNSHIKPLDGIRALAALSILWLHFWSGVTPSDKITELIVSTASIGQIGVPLFFVLSGFLITRILVASKKKENYFLSFYFKRALRIFPLYYLFLVIVFYLYPLLSHQAVDNFSSTWPNWFYLQNIFITFNWKYTGPNHLWSLAVEEHFYLVWPLIVYYTGLRQLKFTCFIIILIEPIVRYLLLRNNIEVFYFSLSRIDELAMGALVAVYEIQNRKVSKKTAYLILATAFAGLTGWIYFTGESSFWIQVFKYSFFALSFHVLIRLIALNRIGIIEQVLDNRLLSFTGKISYGIYIYHPFCFGIIHSCIQTRNIWLLFLLSLSTTYLVSTVSYFFFEKRFLRYKHLFERNAGKRSTDGEIVVDKRILSKN